MANDSIRGRQVVLRLTNKTGGGLVEGDVVIISSANAASVITTTTAGLITDVIGVALETIAIDAIGRICITGYVPKINLSGAASLGDTFATHTVAKQAAPAASRGAGSFGEVLGTGSTPAAVLWGLPDPSGPGGGMASDSLWDAAGDLAIGTGANTGGRLAIGTANQTLRVNAGATAPEWVSAGRVLIGEITPTGTGTLSWGSISATYTSLEIEYVVRGTQAAAYVEGSIFFNNDTTAANYRTTGEGGYGSNTGYVAGADDAANLAGKVPAGTATAGYAGYGFIKIPYYAKTAFHKTAINTFVARRSDSSVEVFTGTVSTHWESTVAINRVDITLSAGNYDTGSTFRLYGVY